MKILLAGAGSIGQQHLQALQNISDITEVEIMSPEEEELKNVAAKFGIKNTYISLSDALETSTAEAVILATPTPLHAKQAIAVLKADKHVLVEIPMSDTYEDALDLYKAAENSDKVAMVAHTRRFNPPHQWLHEQFKSGKLRLHHLVVETLFHRRQNKNAIGQERDWADHLLWHHACHSVDLFRYQANEKISQKHSLSGPISETIGVPLDTNIIMKTESGILGTVALSFNNEGALGSWFRYICEEGTFLVRYDDMTDGNGEKVDYEWSGPTNGIELQNREFISAIIENREPNASVAQCLETMRDLHELEQTTLL